MKSIKRFEDRESPVSQMPNLKLGAGAGRRLR
jgi:hypothetical protein